MSEDLRLFHYGVKGMKWGVRRYQNKNGSLTSEGINRYRAKKTDSSVTKKVKKDLSKMTGPEFRKKYGVSNTRYMKRVDRYGDPYMNSPLAKLGKKIEAEANKNAKRYADKAAKKENRNKERANEIIKNYGDTHMVILTEQGDFMIIDGSDEWIIY